MSCSSACCACRKSPGQSRCKRKNTSAVFLPSGDVPSTTHKLRTTPPRRAGIQSHLLGRKSNGGRGQYPVPGKTDDSSDIQLERETIAERIRDNMMELAKTGRWLGGNTPMGFESEKIEKLNINDKKVSLYKLSPINDEL